MPDAPDVDRALTLLQLAEELIGFQREEIARLRAERDAAYQLRGRLDAILELLLQLTAAV